MAEVKEKDSFKKRQEDAKKKQSGELPPDLDQDGKMINPHNPDFITKVPWYLGDSGPTLKHHNVQKVDHFLSLSESDQLIQSKLQTKQLNQKNKALVFRKGACKNCGAMTHKEKDCVERPRSSRKAAWKSGTDIAADEVVLKMEEHGKVAYDAKRDQWQGYNPEEHRKTVERYERLEAERKKHARKAKEEKRQAAEEAKKAKLEKRRADKEKARAAAASGGGTSSGGVVSDELSDDDIHADSNSDSGSDYDSDEEDSDDEGGHDREFLERDEQAKDFQGRAARQGGVGGAQMKTTVRNLRIREDTPKYLYNLDLDSAHYDPKSHSMRMNPLPNENPEDLQYAGDNFVRHTGDALKLAQTQVLCWEMQARGEDIDVLSSGTQAELVQKQFVEKKKLLEEKKKQELLDRYGVAPSSLSSGASGGNNSSMQAYMSDPRLRLGQTETYQEYSSDGRVIKGPGANKGGNASAGLTARTKYEEDVLDLNHTEVWGSFYNLRTRKWGYGCCHSTDRNCYCIGAKGKELNARESNPLIEAKQMLQKSDSSASASSDKGQNSSTKDSSSKSGLVNRSDVYGEYDAKKGLALDEAKVRAAMERIQREEEERDQDEAAGRGKSSGQKRKGGGYSSMSAEVEVTPEEMEAYRRVKSKRDDPMAALMASGELLEYKP
mmetsp:Transcript_25702/g.43291  ORF Transcript_25702/g.43291 Transcript_25702/m.43291 type:complete len:664 (+) Transcript_25702:63-2054(+)